MNDYLNHKWRKWANEDKTARKKILKEKKSIKTQETMVNLPLPVPQISETWGDPSNADRQEVEALLKRVAPGKSVQAKINAVNKFVNSCKGDDASACAALATSTILSRLMSLEIFAAIVYDFGASSAGFLFEVFVAALLGTDAQQVIASQSRKEGEGGDIADITVGGSPMSLKFFKGGSGGKGSRAIGGSVRDLITSINNYGMPIPYLVAVKDTGEGGDVSAIEFYEFSIGASQGLEELPVEEGMGGDFDIFSNPSWIKETKFKIPVSVLTGAKARQIEPMAVLSFGSREELKEVANNYVGQLGADVTTIYQSLDSLSKNINKYLIRNSKVAGRQAVQDAWRLARRTKKIAPEG